MTKSSAGNTFFELGGDPILSSPSNLRSSSLDILDLLGFSQHTQNNNLKATLSNLQFAPLTIEDIPKTSPDQNTPIITSEGTQGQGIQLAQLAESPQRNFSPEGHATRFDQATFTHLNIDQRTALQDIQKHLDNLCRQLEAGQPLDIRRCERYEEIITKATQLCTPAVNAHLEEMLRTLTNEKSFSAYQDARLVLEGCKRNLQALCNENVGKLHRYEQAAPNFTKQDIADLLNPQISLTRKQVIIELLAEFEIKTNNQDLKTEPRLSFVLGRSLKELTQAGITLQKAEEGLTQESRDNLPSIETYQRLFALPTLLHGQYLQYLQRGVELADQVEAQPGKEWIRQAIRKREEVILKEPERKVAMQQQIEFFQHMGFYTRLLYGVALNHASQNAPGEQQEILRAQAATLLAQALARLNKEANNGQANIVLHTIKLNEVGAIIPWQLLHTSSPGAVTVQDGRQQVNKPHNPQILQEVSPVVKVNQQVQQLLIIADALMQTPGKQKEALDMFAEARRVASSIDSAQNIQDLAQVLKILKAGKDPMDQSQNTLLSPAQYSELQDKALALLECILLPAKIERARAHALLRVKDYGGALRCLEHANEITQQLTQKITGTDKSLVDVLREEIRRISGHGTGENRVNGEIDRLYQQGKNEEAQILAHYCERLQSFMQKPKVTAIALAEFYLNERYNRPADAIRILEAAIKADPALKNDKTIVTLLEAAKAERDKYLHLLAEVPKFYLYDLVISQVIAQWRAMHQPFNGGFLYRTVLANRLAGSTAMSGTRAPVNNLSGDGRAEAPPVRPPGLPPEGGLTSDATSPYNRTPVNGQARRVSDVQNTVAVIAGEYVNIHLPGDVVHRIRRSEVPDFVRRLEADLRATDVIKAYEHAARAENPDQAERAKAEERLAQYRQIERPAERLQFIRETMKPELMEAVKVELGMSAGKGRGLTIKGEVARAGRAVAWVMAAHFIIGYFAQKERQKLNLPDVQFDK